MRMNTIRLLEMGFYYNIWIEMKRASMYSEGIYSLLCKIVPFFFIMNEDGWLHWSASLSLDLTSSFSTTLYFLVSISNLKFYELTIVYRPYIFHIRRISLHYATVVKFSSFRPNQPKYWVLLVYSNRTTPTKY